MRSVLGFAVFVVGLVLAAQTFFPGSLTRSLGLSFTPSKPAIERTESPAASVVDARAVDRVASFSPGAAFAPPAEERDGGMDVLAFLSSQFAGLKSTVSPAAAPRDVALVPWRSAVVATSATMSPDDVRAAGLSNGAKRVALIREIQRELKRVGCYDGNVDGSWGAASKRAMVAFVQRVNASLPLNQPDDILLLLVKGQDAGTCGVACPLGQTLSRDHRCVPDAILAAAGKRPGAQGAAPQSHVAEATSVSPAPPANTSAWPQLATNPRDRWAFSSRMSIGAPQVAAETVTPNQSLVAATATAPQSGTATVQASPQAEVAYIQAGAANEGASTGDAGQLLPPVTETALPAAPTQPRATSSRSRSADRRERRASGSKSVQHLFQHPLGRL